MFLKSNAFLSLDARDRIGFDWSATTILLVSWDWGPNSGPEALAGRRLVEPLLEAGARVHVLAAVEHDETLHHPNYSVTVVPHAPISDNKILRTWEMMRRGIPEPHGLWVSSAVRAGMRLLASLPAETVIYGRAMPGSSNIVAWHLARRTGRTWVAHFSDPWPPVQMLSQQWNWLAGYKWPLFHFWRQRIVRDADALTFTNPQQAAEMLGRHRERDSAKSFVVTHLPSDPKREPRPRASDVFHIVHTGNFYSIRGHSSSAMAQGLRLFLDRTPAAAGRVRFTQAGWHNGDLPEWVTKCDLGGVVNMLGRVTQAEVTALLDGASLLVAVDYAMPNSSVVVSKLPDYITAGRPILAITARESAMGRLFNEDGAGLTARYDSPEEVAERIALIFNAWTHRRFDAYLPQPAAVESFSRQHVLAELAGAFTVARRRRATGGAGAVRALPVLGERTSP